MIPCLRVIRPHDGPLADLVRHAECRARLAGQGENCDVAGLHACAERFLDLKRHLVIVRVGTASGWGARYLERVAIREPCQGFGATVARDEATQGR